MKRSIVRQANLIVWVSIAIVITIALVGTSILVATTVSSSYESEVNGSEEMIGADYFGIRPADRSGGRPVDAKDRMEIGKLSGVSKVALARDAISLATIKVTVSGSQSITKGFEVINVEPGFFSLRHLVLAEGRLFDAVDGGSAKVAVVGADLAAAKGWTVGSLLTHPELQEGYEIIGILNATDASLEGFSSSQFNNMAFTPFDSSIIWNRENQYRDKFPDKGRVTLWVAVQEGIAPTSLTSAVLDRLSESTGQSLYILNGAATRITYGHVTAQTVGSLWQMTVAVAVIGLINIAGLIMMHIFLNAKEIGIRRACGATSARIRLSLFVRYLYLSIVGVLLATPIAILCAPLFAKALGAQVGFSHGRLLLGIVLVLLIGPLASLLPSGIAARLSPTSTIRDQVGWGIGRRRLDVRHLLVAIAFGTATGAVLFISSFGLSVMEDVDRYLRAAGSDLLVISQPPHSSQDQVPQFGALQYKQFVQAQLPEVVDSCWLASARAVVSLDGTRFARTMLHVVDGNVLAVRNFSLSRGQWVGEPDEVVLGDLIANSLFGSDDPVGRQVMLGENQQIFRVAGVLSARPQSLSDIDSNRDEGVFVHPGMGIHVQTLERLEPKAYVLTASESQQAMVVDTIRRTLSQIDLELTGLIVRNPLGPLTEVRHVQQLFSICLLALSAAAVLSTSAGISALTIVQTSEMSKMLAILRACGARRSNILLKILKETLCLITIVAVSGLLVGQLVFLVFARANNLPVTHQYLLLLPAILVAAFLAFISAYVPARSVADRAPADLLD